MPEMATQQETEKLFFGSGVQDLYAHWKSDMSWDPDRFKKVGEWEPGQAPTGWAYKILITDLGNCEVLHDLVITHSVVMKAVRLIADRTTKVNKRLSAPDEETVTACLEYLGEGTGEGFDPHALDQVLQVAVYGGIKNQPGSRRS